MPDQHVDKRKTLYIVIKTYNSDTIKAMILGLK